MFHTPDHLTTNTTASGDSNETGACDAASSGPLFTSSIRDAFPTPATYPRPVGGAIGSLPLDVAEHAFGLLMRGPQPLSVDGSQLGHGLPARPIPLDELGAILLHPSCSRTTRDHVWRCLIDQARTHRGAWMVAAVALAIPMLHRLTKALAEKITADRGDLEAEVLTCYMEAVVQVNLSWSHPVLRLSRLTQFAVIRAYATEQPGLLNDPDRADSEQQALGYPAGHTDLLLVQAVTQHLITAEDAELIALTRLENIPLSSYCRSRGLLYCTALKRRQRAESALYQAILDGDLSSSQ